VEYRDLREGGKTGKGNFDKLINAGLPFAAEGGGVPGNRRREKEEKHEQGS